MNLKSIRWQLPLSYAAIALLAALSLGAILLLTLRRYYNQQERFFLVRNAESVQVSLAPLLAAGLPAEVLQAQVSNLAYFSQARIRLYDPEGNLLVDSGVPGPGEDVLTFLPLSDSPEGPVFFHRELGGEAGQAGSPQIRAPDEIQAPDTLTLFRVPLPAFPRLDTVVVYGDVPFTQEITATAPVTGSYGLISAVPASLAPFNFALGREFDIGLPRSRQVIRLPVVDGQGVVLGSVELLEGPGYGWQIVDSVRRAWLVAGSLAVLLAAAAGWIASRRVTRPLTSLTQVTARMAAGDLSARAGDTGPDEFGRLGQSFNGMAGRVEDTVNTLRRFIADAAHELNTPLTALRTNLELAAGEQAAAEEQAAGKELSSRKGAYLHRAQEQVQRLSRLTESLLDLSRLESNPGRDNWARFDLAAMLREASEPAAAQAEQAGQAFSLQIPMARLMVSGDEAQLRRALGNLLENALKFTPPAGEIRLGLGLEGGQAKVWVEDTGIGIPGEDLGQLFQRFHRGRNAVSYPGSGLGLAIVRAILQAHNGQVAAENLPQGGARFTLSLPADG